MKALQEEYRDRFEDHRGTARIRITSGHPARVQGKSVELYLNDVTCTARRAPGTRPKFIPQKIVEVRYPHKPAGRRY
jgi:hypothetical protein